MRLVQSHRSRKTFSDIDDLSLLATYMYIELTHARRWRDLQRRALGLMNVPYTSQRTYNTIK